MKTAIIFAHECAPYNRAASTIGAQRPAQFAKYFPENGWRLIVICCNNDFVRTAKRKDIPKIVSEIEYKFSNSDPNQSIILATPSLKYSGIIDRIWYSLVNINRDGSFSPKKNIFSFLRKPLTFIKLFTGDYSQSWQPVAYETAKMVAKKINIDLCIAEHGPDASIFVARRFSKKYNIPWIVDFRDPILRGLTKTKKYIYKIIANKLILNAKATINVTPTWAKFDNEHFNLPSYTITNGFDKDEFKKTLTYSYPYFVISYFGAIHYSQDIDLFLGGFKKMIQKFEINNNKLIKFVYRGLAYKEIELKADLLGISEFVDSKDIVPRIDAINIMMNSNLLLLLSIAPYKIADIYCKEGLYPGKVFEYFGCEKPILSIPADNGILDKLINETKTGYVISNMDDIANFLHQCYINWKSNVNIEYKPKKNIVEFYTRQNQSKELCNIINNVVNSI